MGSTYLTNNAKVLYSGTTTPAITAVEASGTETRFVLAATFSKANFERNQIIKISGLDGADADWTALNGLRSVVASLDTAFGRYVSIGVDSSGFDAYAGSMPTIETMPELCNQDLPAITNIARSSASVINVTFDSPAALRVGDIVRITGALAEDGAGSKAWAEINGVDGICETASITELNTYTIGGYTDVQAETYHSEAVAVLTYGGIVAVVDVVQIAQSHAAPITALDPMTAARFLIDADIADEGVFRFFSATDVFGGGLSLLGTITIAAGDTGSRKLRISSAGDVPIAATHILVFFKLDDPGDLEVGERYYDIGGLTYAAMLYNHYVDEHGRVDVGLIRGALPGDSEDLRNAIIAGVGDDPAGDGSKIVTQSGRIKGTGGGTPTLLG